MNNGTQAQCSTCKFSKRSEPDPQTLKRQFVCMRFPPHISAVVVGPGQIMNSTNYPVVMHDWWCGEYQPKLPELALSSN